MRVLSFGSMVLGGLNSGFWALGLGFGGWLVWVGGSGLGVEGWELDQGLGVGVSGLGVGGWGLGTGCSGLRVDG